MLKKSFDMDRRAFFPYGLGIVGLLFILACSHQDIQAPVETVSTPNPAPATINVPEPSEEEERIRDVQVYFRHPVIEGVVPVTRQIFKLKDPADEMKQVVEQLTIVPEEDVAIPIWPQTTYVREIFVLPDGMVVIDFHENFVTSLNAGATTEAFMVFSLVNSILENFPKYDKVQLLVQGEVRESFLGHVDIEFPITSGHHLYKIVPEVRVIDQITSEELPPPEWHQEGLN